MHSELNNNVVLSNSTYLKLWIAKGIFKNKVTVNLAAMVPRDLNAFCGSAEFSMKYHCVI